MAAPPTEPPIRPLRRSFTISHPSSSSSSQHHSITRDFNAGSITSRSRQDPASEGVEVLFCHPTRIISFTVQERPGKSDKDVANYVQPTERTLSSGPMKIYRVKFSTAFLQGGQLLQPLLPRSACWCVDEARGIFVLRIRKDSYYRLELQDIETDKIKIDALKDVLRSTIVFEKTPCPFRVETKNEVFEEQAPLPVFRKKSFAERHSKRRPSLNSDLFSNSIGDESNVLSFRAPSDIPAVPPLPIWGKRNPFEEKKLPKAPRIRLPEDFALPTSPVESMAEHDHFIPNENSQPQAYDYELPATDDEFEEPIPSPRLPQRSFTVPGVLSPSSPFDSDFSFASIATGRRLHDRRSILSSPTSGVLRMTKRSSYIIDPETAASLRNNLSSPPATPPLSLCGTDSDIDGWTEVETPETSRHVSIVNRPGSSSSKLSTGIVIEETDPDFSDMDIDILPPASTIPTDKKAPQHHHHQLSRFELPASPRSLTSLAHNTTRTIFTKTIDLAIHKPSTFLTAFMLKIASRMLRGAVVYTYYWGDWKNGDVSGRGAAGEDVYSTDGDEETEEEEEEDDFGVKILGKKRRRSAPDLTAA